MKSAVFYEAIDMSGRSLSQGNDLPELIEDVSNLLYDFYGEEGAGEHDIYIVHYDNDGNEICRITDTVSHGCFSPSDYEEHNVMWDVL